MIGGFIIGFGCAPLFAVVDLKIVFLPLLAFEVAILIDNVRYSIQSFFDFVHPSYYS
jgi:hypothetical protein